MITGILNVVSLPVQSTFHRFLMALGKDAEIGLKNINQEMMRRVWIVGNVVSKNITIDTDTTVNTVYGEQEKACKGYNPKNKGKKSYMPVMSFIAETGECLAGYNRGGQKMSGKEVAEHIRGFRGLIPKRNVNLLCRADAGFYSWEAVNAYEEIQAKFIIVAQKTPKMQGKLEFGKLKWQTQNGTDGVTEFMYQPMWWPKKCRFLAVRYEIEDDKDSDEPGLILGKKYLYRAFITNMKENPWKLIEFYDGRAGCENLIKEAMHDVGMSSVPSKDFTANCNYFQLGIIAYNFNRWLQILSLDGEEKYTRTKLETQRLTMVYIAAKIVKHAGRIRLSYSSEYEHKDRFKRLLARVLSIRRKNGCFVPVIATPQFA